MTRKKKVGILHYRIGLTDGVSLEISKRKKVFEKIGYQVKLISGAKQIGADFIIPELEFDRPDILRIKENAFFKFKDYKTPNELINDIYRIGNIIEEKFMKIYKKEKFDYLILHNIFTHGRHISVARSFYNITQKTPIKMIAFNHDFYSTYLGMYTPQIKEVKKYLNKYVPPKLKSLKHVVISSPRQKLLKKLINRKAMIFPDTFEFNQPLWKKDKFNKDLLKNFDIKENDLIILQATRIVERKAIELIVDLIKELNKQKKELIGKKLYNGKILDKNSKIILVLAQFAEKSSFKYFNKLKAKMKKDKVEFKFIGDQIEHHRTKRKGKKIYSLWDAYVYADLVSYPSVVEGWGNQFIEAVFAKKPIVVFEYPVFKADIKPEGYKIISLGSTFKKNKQGFVAIPRTKIIKTTNDLIKTLIDKNTSKLLNKNWQIGKKYHGETALKKLLIKMMKL